jgi:cytoskeleton protein RodZ
MSEKNTTNTTSTTRVLNSQLNDHLNTPLKENLKKISDIHALDGNAAIIKNKTHDQNDGKDQKLDAILNNMMTDLSLKSPALDTLRKLTGASVEDVAADLRLHPAQIRALEARDWAKLPTAPYVKGFLRNYARYLKVDALPYIAQFEVMIASSSDQSVSTHIAATSIPNHSEHRDTISSINNSHTIDTTPIADVQSINKTSGYDASLGLNRFAPAAKMQANYDVTAQAHYLPKVAVALVVVTALFLAFWERALWLPTLSAYTHQSPAAATPVASNAVDSAPLANVASANVTHRVEGLGTPPTNNQTAIPLTTSVVNMAPTAATVIASNMDTTATPAVKNTAIAPTAPNTLLPLVTATALPITPKTALTPQAGIRHLEFALSDKTWIKVTDAQGEVLLNGIQSQGTVQVVSGLSPLKVVIGVATSAHLMVDGKPYLLSDKLKGGVANIIVP